MRDRFVAWVPVVGLLLLCGACKSDDEGPAAPAVSTTDRMSDGGTRGGGGRVPIIGGGGLPDAGDDDAGEVVDGTGVLATECDDFDVAIVGEDTIPGALLTGIRSPSDFAVTRSVTTWEDGCGQPTIRLTLSDGQCPSGDGHELRIFIPADSIESGTVVLGQNVILPEPAATGIRVRYVRPDALDPSGEWGTCAEASGTLDLLGELEPTAGSSLQGSFQLDLTRCDGGDANVQAVRGTFNVELQRGVDDVCPDAG